MSGDGSTTFAWGDGEYKFRLGLGELRELQDKCGTGPFVIYQRLADGTWHVDDVREPLRLGLIGGGMNPTMALGKVGRYLGPGQFLENVIAARRVMLAGLFGDPEDTVGKAQAAAAAASQNESNSPTSSAPLQPWDGPSANLTAPAFGNSLQPSMAGIEPMAQAKANGPTR